MPSMIEGEGGVGYQTDLALLKQTRGLGGCVQKPSIPSACCDFLFVNGVIALGMKQYALDLVFCVWGVDLHCLRSVSLFLCTNSPFCDPSTERGRSCQNGGEARESQRDREEHHQGKEQDDQGT